MTADLIIPDLPHKGTCGKHIMLRSNFFRLTSLPIGIIMKYEILISPMVPPRKNRSIYQIWMNECYNDLKPLYDGISTIYSTTSIPDGSFVVCFYDDSIDGIKSDNEKEEKLPQQYRLTVKKVKEIDMGNLVAYLNSSISQSPVEEMQVVDAVLRVSSAHLYTNIGKCFYASNSALRIDHGVELWQGFYYNMQPTEGSLLINLDVSAGAFYQSGSLLETVMSVLGLKSPSYLMFPILEYDRVKLEKHLKNIKVNVTHRGAFRRKFTILKLTNESADNTRFCKNENNEEQTVTEYFAERYDLKLKYGHLPCIVYQNYAGLAFLPFEVCRVVPGQRFLGKLNELQVLNI